ncbi:MAG: nuclear transport factor 2 family protein [Bacteroidota bacterium]
MKKPIPILLLLAACNTSVKIDYDEPKAEDIHGLLDDWHKAAANADFEKYFSYFEGDSSIFMGTDATERWTIVEFKPWSKPYFDRGKAWSFKATERVVYFSKDGKTSWFDEVLGTPNLGPSRGTGVLTKTAGGWKISHYNLAVPIPNEIVGNVVEQIDSVLNK